MSNMQDIMPIRRPTRSAQPATQQEKPQPVESTSAQSLAQPPAPKEANGLRKWGTLVVLSLALAIIVIDTSLLNVSLRTLVHDLHTDIKGMQWVITAYALMLGALTVTGGRLGDLFGRKKMFVSGAIIFAIGSFIASISHNLGMMIAGEAIIEGIGAALMMPATASLLVSTFRGRERAIAFGVWGAIAATASAVGPILGGFLTSHYSWRWGFRINVVVAAILVLGSMLITEYRDRAEKAELDFVGILLSAGGLLAAVFGIIQSSTYGWFKAKQDFAIFGHLLPGGISITTYSIVVGLVTLALFALWEQARESRGHTPLVSLKLFKNTQFTSGALTMAIVSMAMTGLIFVVPVYLQAVHGLDAFHTGLALLPMSLAMLVFGPLSAFLSNRVAPKRLIQTGISLTFLASFVLRWGIGLDKSVSSVAPGLLLFGIGMGMVMAQISNMTLSAVSVEQAGEASGVNNTLRQVGSSLGSAILGAILLAAIVSGVSGGINSSQVIPDQAKPVLSQAIGQNASNAAFGGDSHQGQVSPAVATELTRIGNQATVDAARKTALAMAAILLIAFLSALRLPYAKHLEKGTSATASGGH